MTAAPPIRVLHITPSVRLLGARRSLLTLAERISAHGFEPLVLVPKEEGVAEELKRLGIPTVTLPLSAWRKGRSWRHIPGELRSLSRLLTEREVRLIHCNEVHTNPHAVCAARGILSLASLFPLVLHPPRKPLTDRPHIPVVTHMRLTVTPSQILKYLLPSADRVIAVSHGAAANFDHVPWKEQRVRVVYNGIDLAHFARDDERRAQARAALGLTPDDFVIGQFGLLMPRKRPDFAIRALQELLGTVPQAKLVLIGDTSPGDEDYRTKLIDLAQRLGVETSVRFHPFTSAIAPYYSALDLNLLLSTEEGFGRVVLEAAGARVATIGSDAGGIPELIEDGRTGYIIPNDRFGKGGASGALSLFVRRITELVSHPTRLRVLGENAYERAQAKFSAESYVEGVAAVFREALESAVPPTLC